MFTEWPGYFRPPENVLLTLSRILQLDDNSSESEWMECLEELNDYDGFLCNDTDDSQVFPSKRWTFLHHAAKYHAPEAVVLAMKERKFTMSLKDSEGKMAHQYVSEDSTPEYRQLIVPTFKLANLDMEKVQGIEKQFHLVILSRAENLVEKNNLILPMISVLLETVTEEDSFYFAIPGMYGGFNFQFKLTEDGSDVASLTTESWCRVVGGSGQRHSCTADEYTLEDEGFV